MLYGHAIDVVLIIELHLFELVKYLLVNLDAIKEY